MSDIFASAIIDTDRLRLVPFDDAHIPELNAINNEPEVRRFLSDDQPESLERTQQMVSRSRERWQDLGFSWWTLLQAAEDRIIGAACLQHIANVPGTELEIGWRLSMTATGHGYATEAGLAAAKFAFDIVGVDHVVATADQRNIASHKVMERIGMTFRGIETHYDAPCTTYVLYRSDLSPSPESA